MMTGALNVAPGNCPITPVLFGASTVATFSTDGLGVDAEADRTKASIISVVSVVSAFCSCCSFIFIKTAGEYFSTFAGSSMTS